MTTAYFPSMEAAETVEVEFVTLSGASRVLRLLVDSGFAGRSSVVLSEQATDLLHAQMPPTQTTGALHGTQSRGWVSCRIPTLTFVATLVAIFADLRSLSLPPDIHGLAGLNFLRLFSRWGAERDPGGWRFFLSSD